MKKERDIVLEILLARSENRFVKDIYIEKMQQYDELNPVQKRFIKKLSQGVTEREYTLDYVIGMYSKVRKSKIKKKALNVLRLSIYQILYMDKIPDYSVLHEAGQLLKKNKEFRAVPFCNGLLRSVLTDKENCIKKVQGIAETDWQTAYSFPQELIDLLLQSYDRERVQHILADSLEEKPLNVRLLGKNKEWEAQLTEFCEWHRCQGGGIFFEDVCKYAGNIEDEPLFQKGALHVQDEASMLVGYLAAKESPKLIFDLCASPGGKSTHLSYLLPNSQIKAFDISEEKQKKIEQNIKRLGINNIQTMVANATIVEPSRVNQADCVLADVPCAGLGVIAGKPDMKYRITADKVKSLNQIQAKILEAASEYVKPDGTLIYSTCSILPSENNEMVDAFLQKHTDFTLCDISADEIFQPAQVRQLIEKKELQFKNGMLQLLPGAVHGFFIAKLKKRK